MLCFPPRREEEQDEKPTANLSAKDGGFSGEDEGVERKASKGLYCRIASNSEFLTGAGLDFQLALCLHGNDLQWLPFLQDKDKAPWHGPHHPHTGFHFHNSCSPSASPLPHPVPGSPSMLLTHSRLLSLPLGLFQEGGGACMGGYTLFSPYSPLPHHRPLPRAHVSFTEGLFWFPSVFLAGLKLNVGLGLCLFVTSVASSRHGNALGDTRRHNSSLIASFVG